MIIGIDGSRAFLEKRTGIEEYSFQVIKHLAEKLKDGEVRLYLKNRQKVYFNLPEKWTIREIKLPYFWTQIGLSLEMFFHPADVLFVSGHIVPPIHPKNTIVVVHGLEFEIIPGAYSFWARLYMRFSIKNSCRWAKKIIAVSENTKRDLMKLYKVPEEKIKVIYEGVSSHSDPPVVGEESRDLIPRSFANAQDDKFLLFIGRLEERKNITGIIKAFEILKEKYNIPHKLILAGKAGYGYENIERKIENSDYKNEIIFSGYVSEEERNELLKNAEVFLFPTFYEGFGLPILEAQASGAPIVASNNSSIPEVAGDSAILVNPKKPEEIAEAVWKILNDENFRQELVNKGLKNIERFSWEKCGEEVGKALVKQ